MKYLSWLLMPVLLLSCNNNADNKSDSLPNIVFIFVDDMGYGDIGPFGSTINKTPNLDQMAANGCVFTQFYVSSVACTPSRSALMTGCYAARVGMDGRVNFPAGKRGLNPDELTVAELLKSAGYVTGCYGKWHLGDQPQFMPLAQGFDEYFGIPYSNDMWHYNTRHDLPPLPVIENNKNVAYVSDGGDQSLLCRVITEKAVDFIKQNKDNTFFLYMPHIFVHRPRYTSMEKFEKAGENIVRAQVEEVDWSVGEIMDVLKREGLLEKTLVFFTSDNGGAAGTSMGPLRGGKGGPKYEGNMREPTIARWDGMIPAGAVSDEIGATIDILPTFASLAGVEVPENIQIDGKDISDILLVKEGAKSYHDVLYYQTAGVRKGNWKLVKRSKQKFELYRLDEDIGENNDISAMHPEIVNELKALLEEHEQYIESTKRPAAFVENPKPLLTFPTDLPTLKEYMGIAKIDYTDGDDNSVHREPDNKKVNK